VAEVIDKLDLSTLDRPIVLDGSGLGDPNTGSRGTMISVTS